MTHRVLTGDRPTAATEVGVPPRMPSIAASALQESLRLVALTRRTIAVWWARG